MRGPFSTLVGHLLTAWLIVACASSASPTPTPTAPPVTSTEPAADWLVYHDANLGVSFKYPVEWTVEQSPQIPGFTPTPLRITSASLDSVPANAGKPTDDLKIEIGRVENPDGISAAGLASAWMTDASDAQPTVLTQEAVLVGGTDAIRLDWQDDSGIDGVTYIVARDMLAYVITAVPLDAQLAADLDLWLSTLEWEVPR